MDVISDNIKTLRSKYALTQQQLGKIAGVSDKAVSTWENGAAEPRMNAVRRMAEYFDVSILDIIGPDRKNNGEDGKESVIFVPEDDLDLLRATRLLVKDRDLINLITNLDTMSREDCGLICSLVDKLAKKRR